MNTEPLQTLDIDLIATVTCPTCGTETTAGITDKRNPAELGSGSGLRVFVCSHCGEVMTSDKTKGNDWRIMTAKEFVDDLPYECAMQIADTVENITHKGRCSRCHTKIKNLDPEALCDECKTKESHE